MNIIKLNLPERSKFAMSDQIIYSDTLFSAIVNCYVKLYGDEKISNFIENVKVSSIFIGFQLENEEMFLLPKPHFTPKFLIKEDIDRDDIKDWKKVKFLSKSIFEKVINGEEDIAYKNWSGVAVSQKEYEKLKKASKIGDKFDKQNFIKKYSETKNALNRYTGASENLFSIDTLEFQKIGNITPFLYFFTENTETEFMASLRLMADEGLGGDRSTGKGTLDSIKEGNLELDLKKTDKYINLSLIMPKDMEEARKVENYQFVKRGGYVFYGGGTGWRKQRIRMFDIGSVFNQKIEGINVESEINLYGDGDKTIYHYGKAFLVGGEA